MLGKAKDWGMRYYEQDEIYYTFTEISALQSDVSTARNWLINMGNSADALGVSIQVLVILFKVIFISFQYSGHFAQALLQSTEIPAVTQARTSHEYLPGNKQWQVTLFCFCWVTCFQVFYNNLLVWSLGMAPVKGTFWTSESESDCE